MSEKNYTTHKIFDQNKDNGCIAISGKGYYVPLSNFIEEELTSIENLKKAEEMNVLFKKEKAKNAFISVTGKSLTDIQIDAINEMVFKLSDGRNPISLDDIQNYINEKEKDF